MADSDAVAKVEADAEKGQDESKETVSDKVVEVLKPNESGDNKVALEEAKEGQCRADDNESSQQKESNESDESNKVVSDSGKDEEKNEKVSTDVVEAMEITESTEEADNTEQNVKESNEKVLDREKQVMEVSEAVDEKKTEEDNTKADVKETESKENGSKDGQKADSKEEEETLEDDENIKLVNGIIFQFSEDMILYEFNIDGDDVIGEISTENLLLANGEKISKKEEIASHIQCGDEIKCRVSRDDNIKEFSFEEDEEEIGEDGEVTRTTRTVKIKPLWTAKGAGRIQSANPSGQNLQKEDVLALEDQLEDMFDYEPDEAEDEDDIILIEEVKIDDEVSEAKKQQQKPPKDCKSVEKKNVTKPTIVKKVEEVEEETFVHQAKLYQIRRPNNVQDAKARVSSCVLELLDGKHAGRMINAVSVSMYMWGYNLAKANLNSVIKYGDLCQVEYKIQPKQDEFVEDLLVVKKCHFGPRVEKPIRPGNDKSFSVFLSNRGMDETGFLKWVYGQSATKPFFPFVSEIYEASIKEFVRDTSTNGIIGVLLENIKHQLKVNKDGALVKPHEEVKADEPEEPAPPGIEETEAETFVPEPAPADENDWTPLHHLQNCCMNGLEYIVNEKMVKIKDLEFSRDEVTQFQVGSTGLFYGLGTLAYFMKNRGLKYSAYVKRTEALKQKQYVKRADVDAVINYLTMNEPTRQVKKIADVMEEDNQIEIFNDRASIADDTFTIPSKEVIQPEVVFANDSDFFIGGVSIGKCDIRLLVKIGDKVMCQVHEMSSAEKRKFKKQSGLSIEHMATLVYTGSEKRPKSATLTPVLSPELTAFLKPMGWTMEEFAALRTFGLRPPSNVESAQDLIELVAQSNHAQVPIAVNLTKEAMKIPSSDSPLAENILKNDDDIKVAVFLSKVLTTALLSRIQHNLKAKLHNHYVTKYNAELQSQISKIAAAETTLSKKKEKVTEPPPAKKKEEKPKRTPITAPAKDKLPEKLKEVETKLAKETQKKQAANKELGKNKAPIRDARKLLQSYKETKKMDINEGLPKFTDEWTPLEYLRHFAIHKKKITFDDTYIYFGRERFLKTTKTNFQAAHGDVDSSGKLPWYTLDALYLAYLHKGHKHSKYLEKLKDAGKRFLNLNHRDRDAFIKYIEGNSATPANVKSRTRRELNPDQYMDMIPTPSASSHRRSNSLEKYSLEALRKDEEQNLKARMQLHLLESQSNVAPQYEPPKKQSRFDQPFHPNQAHQQPAVVIPQQIGYGQQTPSVSYQRVSAGDGHQRPPSPHYRPDHHRPEYRSEHRLDHQLDRRQPEHFQSDYRQEPPLEAPQRRIGVAQWANNPSFARSRSPEIRYDSRMRSRSPVRVARQDYDPSFPTTSSPPRRHRPSPPPTMRWPSPLRRQQEQTSDITKRWTQEMSSITGRGASRADGDALERLAAQEAQREEERMRSNAARLNGPQIIDLADSDDEDHARPLAPRRFAPSPPRLSQSSWHPAEPLRHAYENRRNISDMFPQPMDPMDMRQSSPPRSAFPVMHSQPNNGRYDYPRY